jgi:hypothetical protein
VKTAIKRSADTVLLLILLTIFKEVICAVYDL